MTLKTDPSAKTRQANSGPTIRAIHVVSSGSAKQHEEHRYGSSLPRLWWALLSRSWVSLPLHYFVIEHKDGPILFDTGIDPRITSDPDYIDSAIGRFLLSRIFQFDISESDRLDHKLAGIGIDPADVDMAVFSHLHFDHVGGISRIPGAKLIVSEAEWAQLSEPHPEREWILRDHIQLPDANWTPFAYRPTDDPLFAAFSGIHDVKGDGSLILLPTPGHTPGSLSMLIRNDGWAPILLIGDLCYEASLIADDAVAGTGDAKQLRQTYEGIRDLQAKLPDLVIVPSHDFIAPDEIKRAMKN